MHLRLIHFPSLRRRDEYEQHRRASDYKNEIREDCQMRCVYCDVHESEIGGEENMCLDHFRPKSIDEFKKLKDDPFNLHLACHPCNQFKANDWPALGTDNTFIGRAGYLDPFRVDRNDYFNIVEGGDLEAVQDPAEYMIIFLNLNRPYLKKMRRRRDVANEVVNILSERFEIEVGACEKMLEEPDLSETKKIGIRVEIQDIKQLIGLIEELHNLYKLH